MFRINIKKLREQRGWSQYDLAKELNIRQSTVGMWESGKNVPKQSTLQRIAELFDVSTDYLLGRSIVPNDKRTDIITIPVLGRICAGIPMEAVEEIIDYEELSVKDFSSFNEYFGLQIKGDSMEPEYRDGDTIIVRKQSTVETGDDAVILVNGDDAVFKRVRVDTDGISVIPLNAAKYTPWYYTNKQVEELPVTVLGVAVEVRRKIK